MPLSRPTLDALRLVVRALEDDVTDYLLERVMAVHEGIKPGTTTLEEVTHLKGKADGAAELWQTLKDWAREDEE